MVGDDIVVEGEDEDVGPSEGIGAVEFGGGAVIGDVGAEDGDEGRDIVVVVVADDGIDGNTGVIDRGHDIAPSLEEGEGAGVDEVAGDENEGGFG